MADTKVSGLTALTGANVDTAADVLNIVDTSVTTSKKILVDELAIAVVKATVSIISTIWVPALAMVSRTETASRVTSTPMPSPGRTVILDFMIDRLSVNQENAKHAK